MTENPRDLLLQILEDFETDEAGTVALIGLVRDKIRRQQNEIKELKWEMSQHTERWRVLKENLERRADTPPPMEKRYFLDEATHLLTVWTEPNGETFVRKRAGEVSYLLPGISMELAIQRFGGG